MTATPQQIRDFLELFNGDAVLAAQSLQAPAATLPKPQEAPSGPVVLSVKDVAKRYKRGKQVVNALNGVSLDIHEGEFVALTGASGSGKSTLLQLMGGLDKPTSGEITIEGHDLSRLKDTALAEFRNQTIGFVFQFFYLQPFLPLGKNVEVPGMFGHVKPADRQARVRELLQIVGLSEQAQQLPKQLSGGQIQRAAVARALLNKPRILLADEPTGNLDSTNSAAIIELFKHIRATAGTTVVIVTHNPDIAAQADREIRLSDGVLV
ncbi:MAG TPA: ABC transporter ATP-binding protein [Candidatus Saccharimonadia bacterium]|nr:ABC transporter ATP-binding protein [Candidatus Saccharimonadia bacterium]